LSYILINFFPSFFYFICVYYKISYMFMFKKKWALSTLNPDDYDYMRSILSAYTLPPVIIQPPHIFRGYWGGQKRVLLWVCSYEMKMYFGCKLSANFNFHFGFNSILSSGWMINIYTIFIICYKCRFRFLFYLSYIHS
jgi:hypothetical protein